ncbi:hypothetical protein [Mesobacillus boroniphilus]|nr:hypothetical protein [Mesobacillus boroniphilus]
MLNLFGSETVLKGIRADHAIDASDTGIDFSKIGEGGHEGYMTA